MEELGLEEALEDGAALMEWPERAPERIARRCAACAACDARWRTAAPDLDRAGALGAMI